MMRKLVLALKYTVYITHCTIAVTTKAASSVLKCTRKPTRQSLSLESCHSLRHLPISRTPAVFSAAGVYFLVAPFFLFFIYFFHPSCK